MFPINIIDIKKTEKTFINLIQNGNNIFKIILRNEFNKLKFASLINKHDGIYIAVCMDLKNKYYYHRLENDIHCDTFSLENDQILKQYMANNYSIQSLYYNRNEGRRSIRLVRGFCVELNQQELLYHGFILIKFNDIDKFYNCLIISV
eukprot:142971_1